MTTCIKKNKFFHATGHTSPSCYVACQKPQSSPFSKISLEQKKTDKMTCNDQSMRDSPCSQTESYSTVFFTWPSPRDSLALNTKMKEVVITYLQRATYKKAISHSKNTCCLLPRILSFQHQPGYSQYCRKKILQFPWETHCFSL